MSSTHRRSAAIVAPTSALPTPRNACFLLLTLGAMAWLWTPFARVVALSLQYGEYEHHSHIVLIPATSAFLLFLNRRAIFADLAWAPAVGATLIAAGIVSSWGAAATAAGGPTLSWAMLSLVTVVLGAFVLCYGVRAFRRASFGLLFLYLMVPVPPSMLATTIGFLQRASADAAGVLFGLLGAPVFREGLVFHLPRLAIVVAEECSGIRSSLALLICGLVAGHLSLRSTWTKVALVGAVIPLAIAKNAVRIVTLSLLATHVDPSFITDSVLHRNGGIPLFAVSLAALCALVWLLRRIETGLTDRRVGRLSSTDQGDRRPPLLDRRASAPRAAAKERMAEGTRRRSEA